MTENNVPQPVPDEPATDDQPKTDKPPAANPDSVYLDGTEAGTITEPEVENTLDKAVDDVAQTAKQKAHTILGQWYHSSEIEKILQELERRGLALIHVK